LPQGNFVAHWQRGAEGLGFAQAADYGGEFRAPFHFTLGHSATFSERPIRHNRARGSDRSPIRGWKPERGRSQGRGARYARSAAKRASILDGSPSGGYSGSGVRSKQGNGAPSTHRARRLYPKKTSSQEFLCCMAQVRRHRSLAVRPKLDRHNGPVSFRR